MFLLKAEMQQNEENLLALVAEQRKRQTIAFAEITLVIHTQTENLPQ